MDQVVSEAVAVLNNPQKIKTSDISDESHKPPIDTVPKEEPKVVEPEKKKEDLVSAKFAALARETKKLQELKKQLDQQKNAPELKEIEEFKKIKAEAKNDVEAALNYIGLSFEDVNDWILSGKQPKSKDVRALEEKLAAIERAQKEKEEKASKELKEREDKTTYETIINFVKTEVQKDMDQFELINAYNAYESVYKIMLDHYNETNQALPVKVAAEKIEAELESESMKYKDVKKLKKLFGAIEAQEKKIAAEETKAEDFKPTITDKKTTTTLTNEASNGQTEAEEEDYKDTEKLLQKAARLLQS